MDKLSRPEYQAIYMDRATRLATYRIALDWYRLEPAVPAEEAAAWAGLGFQPHEAAPLIGQGITAAMQAAGEAIESDVAGGSDELAAQRIDELVRDGLLIDPALVRIIRDEP